jgi:2-hydroxychromene-2-carboxylate isomerase
MIRFYFDYLSPYAYLASTQIRALGARHGHEVEAVPILFAALLDANGSKGPAEVPRRRAYIYKDVMRLAHALGQPIGVPATHPFNPLAPLRATAAIDDPIARWRLVDALYRATWVDGLRVDQPEVVARVAAEAGFDGLLQTAGIKERLRANTEEALAAGCFGVPSMIVDGELFFGCDSLPHLERFLRGEDPLTREALARWETLQPSAMRRA